MKRYSSLNILLIEDNPADVLLLQSALETDRLSQFNLTRVERLAEGLQRLKQESFDIALVDLGLPDSSGLETFTKLHAQAPDLPVVVFSGDKDEEQAIRAVRAGAQDYLVKGVSGFEMAPRTIRYAVERQSAQSALRESEERFSTAFFTNPVAQSILSLTTGQVLEVNDAACRLYEYDREELIGLDPGTLNLWANPDDQLAVLEELQRTGHLLPREVAIRRKSGGIGAVLFAAEPITWKGEPCLITSSIDVTERKKSENALRESEKRFAALFRSNPVPIGFTRSSDYSIVDVNDAWMELTGYTREEALGNTSTGLGLARPETLRQLRGMLDEQGNIGQFEIPLYTRSGQERSVLITSEPVELEGETYFLNNLLDITERKQAEEALQKNERILRLFVEHSPAAIAMFDCDMRYIAASRRYLTDFRLGEQNLTGRSHYDVFPEMTADRKEIHRCCLAGEVVKSEEDPLLRADGTLDWVRYELHPWHEANGDIGGLIFFSEVITERKQAEQALRESEERLELVLDGSQLGYWDWDIKTGTVHHNERWAEMLGYTLAEIELNVRQWTDLHHPDDRAAAWKSIQDHLDGHTFAHRVEYRMRTKDGGYKWILDQARILERDPDGNPLRMCGTHTDITERKEAEEKLRQRLTELEVLYASGLILNRLASPQEIGEKVIELLEQKMNWHHSVIRLHNPEDRSLSLLAFSQPMLVDEQERQKMKEFLEKNVMRSDEGLSGWAVQANQAIRINNISEDPRYRESYTGMSSGLYVPISLGENVIGVISIESEKTDGFSESDERFVTTLSNQAAVAIENARLNNDLERRVRERTAEVQDLYDNAPTGYHSLDSSGCFTQVNQTELNWLGYSKEELLGRPVTELLTGHSIAIFREEFPVFKRNGWLHDLELEFICKDGSTMPALVNAIAIYDAQGNYTMSRSTIFNNTERKKIEIALRESQENLQYFFDTASDLIQSMDENGNYLYVNSAWSKTLGYSPREALQMTMADVIDPTYQEHCRELLNSLIADQHPRQMEVVFRNKAGDPVIVDGSVSSRKDKSGHIITNGIFRNITERKKAEDALRTSEARLNFLLSKTPAMIFSANLSYPLPITFMSDSAREIVGYEPQQYYEDPGFWLNLVHPDDVDTGMLAMQGLIEKGHAVWESRILRPDGAYQWMSTGTSLMLGENGQPHEIIGFSVNIDDRKQAEEALRQSEEQNRLLFEEAPESVVLLDDHGRILRMNRAFETLTGYPREILLGRRAEQTNLLPPPEMQSLLQSIEDNVRSGAEFTSLSFKLIRADGTPRDVRINVFPLRIQGKVHYLSTMHDVTTEKQAEETLRLANNELERALRLKDEFLANMSHELRTPLNAILGISESLAEQVAGPLNEKQVKYTQTIQESGQHLLALINDVLDLAKINAGKVELDMGRVDAAALAQSCLRLVRELAHKKDLDISLELDPTVSLFWADERRLKQMIVNLLSNAVKFTPAGGRIGLEIRGDLQGRILRFCVWDTGIGIHPEEVQYLFQPFVQLDAGLARGTQGTGLGLVLVSQMARLHGGSVGVESQPGLGSRFTISIPWVNAQTGSLRLQTGRSAVAAAQPQARAARPVVLLIEDTEAITMLIHDYLESHGFQVFVARNGLDGIAQARQVHPQIILMDVMMPEMDGLETTRRLRVLQEFKGTPIIALTALAMPGDRERCLAAGMNDYLAKPVNLRELVSLLEQYLAPGKEGGA